VQRARDPQEQRRTVVQATAKGLKLVETLSQSIEAHYQRLERGLGKDKLGQLYGLLDELIALEEPA
jgi:DNA-binding MarR family transcriptional regulator